MLGARRVYGLLAVLLAILHQPVCASAAAALGSSAARGPSLSVIAPFHSGGLERVVPVQGGAACNFRATSDYYGCRGSAIERCYTQAKEADDQEDAVEKCDQKKRGCDDCVGQLFACGDRIGAPGSRETCASCRFARDQCWTRWGL